MRKILLAFFLVCFSTLAHANCTITALPFILQNGTTADATQVMADLNQIYNGVQAGCAGSGANTDITSLAGQTAGISATAGQVGELKLISPAGPGQSGTITFTNGSANIGWGANVPVVGETVYFTTTGTLPTNFSTLTNYYVVSVVGSVVQVSATFNGLAISAGSPGSGTHTGTVAAYLSTGTSRDVAFITLTPGDWTCSANVALSWNSAGTYTVATGSMSPAANTYNGAGTLGAIEDGQTSGNLNSVEAYAIGEVDFNSSGTVTVFLNASANFGGGAAVSAFGSMRCRRIR